MFKNKHLILAMLIAPVLAVIAYFGVDLAVSEKPHAAKEGETYKLVARSNCRYTSGLCDLENGDFEVQLRSESLTADSLVLTLSSKFPLQGAKIALVPDKSSSRQPENMNANNTDGTNWSITLPAPTTDSSQIRLVVSADGTLYFADTPATFIEYKTFFTEDQKDNS